ncbi:MAG: dethiobiotin synthase [Phenylobacterium zucineum]|nr:MAG: dethiobiotin synthase [Phenylobacterium zucineum]
MSPRQLFVAGAHTEIGKTHVACGLLRAARAEGLRVDALKPVVSGFDPADWSGSDPCRLLQAIGAGLTEASLVGISPWRFDAALAPPMAADLEGRRLDLAEVVAWCRRRATDGSSDLLLTEGVGGLMSPLTHGATSLDLLEALGAPAVLVGGTYLGAVSHTLTALEVMRARGHAPLAIFVSEDAGPDAPDFAGTVRLVEAHAGGVPVVAVPRQPGFGWATAVVHELSAS